MKSYVADGQVVAKTPQGEMTLRAKETLLMPDRFRQDMTLPMGRWRSSSPAPTPGCVSRRASRRCRRRCASRSTISLAHAVLLLRHRAEPGFEAVAAGEGKAATRATALVAITFKGRTTTLGSTPQTRPRL